jgi:diguanylate cyclase (GGDEF)-like protein
VRLYKAASADRLRFIVLYLFMTFGLLIAAGLFLYEARVIISDSLLDEDAVAVLSQANRVLHDLEDAETGQRGYLLTGDESYLQPYRQGVQDLDDTVLRLHRVVAGDEPSEALVERVEHTKTDKIAELARTIELVHTGHRDDAMALVRTNEGKRYMDVFRDDMGQLLDRWQRKRKAATRDAHERLVFGTAALAVVAVLVGCLMIYTLHIQRRAFAKVHAWSAALDREAAHDPLTGLPNRRRLLSALDALNAQLRFDAERRIALLFLDIDGFKSVNDTLGHSAGDALLRRIADALREATRQSDVLARVGGDEFVLLAPDCGDDAQLRELSERLISCVRVVGKKEFDGRFEIGVSIGIATFPDRVQSVEKLLDVADAAMYVAKRGGRSTWSFGVLSEQHPSNVVRLKR